ncbi:DDE transposase family protein [Myxacorys almedinensis]|uniref:DDE transposase family protein n=1 Tax=Myxacorys almedinensis A TaxID=2690445 RepID=A0A8J8CLZ0_9CYAN|nr:DDE transposase family protein [Myxacorys almedinensis]NDJ16652.1 DDE transposase family protein [Myxacorys almedinensis A]
MSQIEGWYVVKQPEGHCQIVSVSAQDWESSHAKPPEETEKWGPFGSEGDAIARRVGLIRAGKCRPV